jgi:hypothetical protein
MKLRDVRAGALTGVRDGKRGGDRAAREDQLQALVRDRAVVEIYLVYGRSRLFGLQQPRPVLERPLASHAVDGVVAPGDHQPVTRCPIRHCRR